MRKRILVGTRKGLLILEKKMSNWQIVDDHFLGIPVNMVFEDSRNGTWWVSLDHGHWGMKLHKSEDEGGSWEEIAAPQYPEGSIIKDEVAASLKYIWAFAENGEKNSTGIWIGTEPGGLFSMTGDHEANLVQSLWDHPSRPNQWFGGGRDYAGIHSVVVDPRDRNHIYVGISVAGVFETRDGGASWKPANRGLRADFLPDPQAEVGHDPHLLVACDADPDVMWQQNHCGIFRSTNGAKSWEDISDPEGEANFGFAIAIDHTDPLRAWVAPAISDEVRVARAQKLCICRTDDGGKSWMTFREGLPQEYCYDIVYRHALIADGNDVIFGTSTGNLFSSSDEGENWEVISNYLPMVYCLTFVG